MPGFLHCGTQLSAVLLVTSSTCGCGQSTYDWWTLYCQRLTCNKTQQDNEADDVTPMPHTQTAPSNHYCEIAHTPNCAESRGQRWPAQWCGKKNCSFLIGCSQFLSQVTVQFIFSSIFTQWPVRASDEGNVAAKLGITSQSVGNSFLCWMWPVWCVYQLAWCHIQDIAEVTEETTSLRHLASLTKIHHQRCLRMLFCTFLSY